MNALTDISREYVNPTVTLNFCDCLRNRVGFKSLKPRFLGKTEGLRGLVLTFALFGTLRERSSI